jgi:DNA-binding response OmpR family regulator
MRGSPGTGRLSLFRRLHARSVAITRGVIVVLVDVQLPDIDGFGLIAQLDTGSDGPAIVLVSPCRPSCA